MLVNRRLISRWLFSLFALLTGVVPLHGQSPKLTPPPSPSLNETIEWLTARLEQSVNTGYATRSIKVETFEQCKFVLIDSWKYFDQRAKPNVYRRHLVLRDLDPEHHKIDPLGSLIHPTGWNLTIQSKSGKFDLFTCFAADTECNMKIGSREMELVFTERDVAERVSKALSHATLLCGGSRSPF